MKAPPPATQRFAKNGLSQGWLRASSAVVFDREGMLERLMNDEEMARVVIEIFLDDMPCQIDSLRRYLDASDASGAARKAHLVRGAAATVGGEALCALACEMEKAGKAGDLGFVAARMDDLERQFLRLKKAMKKAAHREGTSPCAS